MAAAPACCCAEFRSRAGRLRPHMPGSTREFHDRTDGTTGVLHRQNVRYTKRGAVPCTAGKVQATGLGSVYDVFAGQHGVGNAVRNLSGLAREFNVQEDRRYDCARLDTVRTIANDVSRGRVLAAFLGPPVGSFDGDSDEDFGSRIESWKIFK